MKIITWNINGIRSAIAKNALDWAFAPKPDALCLQEVKARPQQLSEDQNRALKLPHAWNPAQRPGYSGVATFYKREPDEIKLGMGVEKFDVEGRVIQTVWQDVRLLNIYFPSGSSGEERVAYKLDFYAHLLEICDSLHNSSGSLILTGDFNTAHTPLDLTNARQNAKTSGFLPEEREWVTRYLQHGFVDAYRNLYPEKVEYTWWTNRVNARERNVGWRLDYFLVSENLMPRVKNVLIHKDVTGSDHCPVEMNLK